MAITVPGQGSDAVTLLNAPALQQVRHFTRPHGSVFHGVAVDIAFTATADNARIGVRDFSVLKQTGNQ